MPDIYINIADKIAQTSGTPLIVNGNSDYTVHFTFDSEWDAYPMKVMRVVMFFGSDAQYYEVIFTGDTAVMPPIYNARACAIGVWSDESGDGLRTTASAMIPCAECISDHTQLHHDPPPDVYEQLLDYLSQLEYGEPFSTSDVQPVSNGGVSEDIMAIAEEVN